MAIRVVPAIQTHRKRFFSLSIPFCPLFPLPYPLVLVSCWLLLLSPVSFGQAETATVSGTVMDMSGAVIVDAEVRIVNVDTNAESVVKTNGSGIYFIPGLKPGNYRIFVSKPGFKTVNLSDLVLNVQSIVSRNFTLQVGAASETITVTAGGYMLNTTDATVSTVVDRQFVENIPLNGRSFQSLITLTPGVVLTKAGASGGSLEQGQFSINGQRADANYFMVDGVSANIGMIPTSFPGQFTAGALPGLTAFGGSNNLVSVDAVQEFRVQTSSYAPEFGRTPGGQVSIVTRSGTNEFHGGLFEYFRNDALDAKDWFANQKGLPKTALRQNDFGGVLGGPIIKDRTFFFFSYEGLRLRVPQTATNLDVPSLAARQAALAGIQPFLNAYPKPNGPDKGNGFATLNSSFSNPSDLDAYSIRVDQVVSSKWTLFGRYNRAPSSTVARGGTGNAALSVVSPFKTTTQFVTLGATVSATARLSNDLRLNYSRVESTIGFKLDDFGEATVPSDSSVFPSFASSADSQFTLVLGGNSTLLASGAFLSNLQRQINLVDSISFLSSNHLMKFGVDYRRLSPVLGFVKYSQNVSFLGVGTPGATPPRGSALSGTAFFVSVLAQSGTQVPISNNLSLYAQDTWKISPRLAFTYGLRWEYNPPPKDGNGHDPAVATGLDAPATLALAPPGTPLWKTTHNNLTPRVGVAYLLGRRSALETVLRGGFGIFYDLGNAQAGNAFSIAFPFATGKSVLNVPFPLSPSNAAPPPFVPTGALNNFFFFDPNLKLPRTYQWNVAVEQSLGASQAFSMSYVGAVGRRLLRQERLRSGIPGFPGLVNITKNIATSDYHALQLQYRRRLSRGLQGLASYTWSHSIDIASVDSSLSLPPSLNIGPALDRGASNFDVRHVFNGALTYDIPAPKTRGLGSAFLGGWSVDTILTARSATPVDVTYSASTSFGFFPLRPDGVPGLPRYLDDPNVPGGRRINRAALSIPSTLGRQGTLERNARRGFSVFQMDFGLRRQFHLTEKLALRFSSEFFNVFNHPNFADPDGNFGTALPGLFIPSTAFGISPTMLGRSLGSGGAGGGFNPLFQIGGPRSIQLSLKLRF